MRQTPRKHKKHTALKILAALGIVCAALLLLSRYGLRVTRFDIASDRLPGSFDGYRIVQLSDLHGSRFGPDNSRLIEKVAAEKPDMIVLTGDFLDEGKVGGELPEVAALCEALVAIAPVYFVSGNHDWASGGIEELAAVLSDAGVTYLHNEYLTVERGGGSIVLCGVEDPNGHADMTPPDALAAEARADYPDDFLLLLGHRNYWAEKYPAIAADLILCGHSHGGIIRIPGVGGLLGTNASFFPEYEGGLYETDSYTMIVSCGLGNSVSMPRFMNTPEIISLTLHTE